MSHQQLDEATEYVIGYKRIRIYQLNELRDGNRVIVAKAVTKQGVRLNEEQIQELSLQLGNSIAEIDCYEGNYLSQKYAYSYNQHIYFC